MNHKTNKYICDSLKAGILSGKWGILEFSEHHMIYYTQYNINVHINHVFTHQ